MQFRQDGGLRDQMHRFTRDEFYSYVIFPRVNLLIKMAENIDADVLISLIEARPVLWDKTPDVFKDRIATRNAWREVCLALKPRSIDRMHPKEVDYVSAILYDDELTIAQEFFPDSLKHAVILMTSR